MKTYMVLIGVACILLGCGDTTYEAAESPAVPVQEAAEIAHSVTSHSPQISQAVDEKTLSLDDIHEETHTYLQALTATNGLTSYILFMQSNATFQDKLSSAMEFIRRAGRHPDSIEECERVLKALLNTTVDEREQNRVRMEISQMYGRFKSYDRGISLLESMLKVNMEREEPNENLRGALHQRLAALNMMAQQHEESLLHAKKAYDIHVQNENEFGIRGARSDLAIALANMGQFDEAYSVVNTILEYNQSTMYTELRNRIQMYRNNPHLWQTNTTVFTYHY